jgi:hypothetical protein
VLRLVFAPAMVASLVLAVAAIRRGDVVTHRAWMTRAYAIAVAAGTQALTEGAGGAVFGHSALVLDASRGAAWVVNPAFAEWMIRRRPAGGGARRLGGGARRHRPAATLLVGDRP